jgi:hypothetical protein
MSTIKGRGAASNPEGRFESVRRESVDDGWFPGEADEPVRLCASAGTLLPIPLISAPLREPFFPPPFVPVSTPT